MLTNRKTIAIEPVLPRVSVARTAHAVAVPSPAGGPRRLLGVAATHRVRANLVLRVVAKKSFVRVAAGKAEDEPRHA